MAATGSYDLGPGDLRALMGKRKEEMVAALEDEGGTAGLMEKLKTCPEGLVAGDEADLKRRREVFGQNWIPAAKSKSFLRLLWEAFLDPLLIILAAFALVGLGLSLYTKFSEEGGEESLEWLEPVAIVVAVVLVMVVTAVNDWKKEKQFRGLKEVIEDSKTYSAMRSGEVVEVSERSLVVGDVIILKYGDKIPADGILLRSSELRVDESSMTGENDLVKKSVEKDPLVLSSTKVMLGSGKALVTAVGENSQAGDIQMLLGEEAPGRTVLQAKLFTLTIWIGVAGVVLALLTTIVLLVQYGLETEKVKAKDIINRLMIGVTILVVAIPEGLPLAVTISLAYSVKKMMADNNLVRHLNACETMGNATIICTDKTGTLTTNQMTVVQAFLLGESFGQDAPAPLPTSLPDPLARILGETIAYNSSYTSAVVEEGATLKQMGNKTECALLAFLTSSGIDYHKLRQDVPEDDLVKVWPFNSEKKRMTSCFLTPEGEFRLMTKGAAELMVERCSFIIGKDGARLPLDQAGRQGLISKVVTPMTEAALRTIAVAYKDFDSQAEVERDEDDEELSKQLTLLAIFGIEDPVREEVPLAIKQCQEAGISVRMVTGDNLATARAIAVKCGILKPENSDFLVLEGEEFNRRVKDEEGEVDQKKLDEIWPQLGVLARSKPRDKFTLVHGIINSKVSASREVVAVTGDGTNDAPALKEADVGFAMGIAGTEVAKEASDIILTDDNFNSIVKAVLWGRNVYDSICKFLQFQLTVNLVAVLIAFIGAATLNASPLRALQMLWVNLIMDTLAALALATEQPTPELLKRAPYGRTAFLISPTMARNIFSQALFQLAVLLGLLFAGDKLPKHCLTWESSDNNEMCTIENFEDVKADSKPTQLFTMVFNAFILMTLFNEVNCRRVHGERNVVKHLASNPLFVGIWVTCLALQVLIVETPGLGPKVFFTTPLSLFQWFVCILAGLGSLVCYQLVLFIPICAKEEKTVTKGERQGKMGNQVERVGQPLLKLRSSGRKNSSIGRGSSVAHSYSVKEDRVSEIRRPGE